MKVSVMGLAEYSDNGLFAPRKIADAFRTTSEEIARTAGLGKDAVQRKDRVRSELINEEAPPSPARSGPTSKRGS
jgi:hypothetical protein